MDLDPDRILRCRKLIEFMGRIKRNFYGSARLTIENGCGTYYRISQPATKLLVALAKSQNAAVTDWDDFNWAKLPESFSVLYKGFSPLSGIHSCTLIDETGIHFQGTDSEHLYISPTLYPERPGCLAEHVAAIKGLSELVQYRRMK